MSARPVVLASRPELAHLDIAKRTALVRISAPPDLRAPQAAALVREPSASPGLDRFDKLTGRNTAAASCRPPAGTSLMRPCQAGPDRSSPRWWRRQPAADRDRSSDPASAAGADPAQDQMLHGIVADRAQPERQAHGRVDVIEPEGLSSRRTWTYSRLPALPMRASSRRRRVANASGRSQPCSAAACRARRSSARAGPDSAGDRGRRPRAHSSAGAGR